METTIASSIMASWPVGVLSTYGRAGIDAVPIVFAVVDGVAYSPVDNKPKRGTPLARIRNIQRDPRFTLLLQNYDDDWSSLWWLKVSGTASLLPSDASLTNVREALELKYAAYRDDAALLAGLSQVLRLDIGSTRAWAYQGEAWLRRTFRT